jgi:hypothetical protein
MTGPVIRAQRLAFVSLEPLWRAQRYVAAINAPGLALECSARLGVVAVRRGWLLRLRLLRLAASIRLRRRVPFERSAFKRSTRLGVAAVRLLWI